MGKIATLLTLFGLSTAAAFGQSGWEKIEGIVSPSSTVGSITAAGSLAYGSVSNDPLHGAVTSTDSGETWVGFSIVAPSKLKALSYSFIYGIRGDSIMTSTTQGLSWSVLRPSLSASLADVYFATNTRAWAVGKTAQRDTPIVARTSDGWQTPPQRQALPQDSVLMISVQFLGSDTGFALGQSTKAGPKPAVLFRTTNGGASWQKRGGLPDTCSGAPLLAVDFVTPGIGWAVQTCPAPLRATIYKTTDGGLTWISQTTFIASLRFYAIDAVSPQYAWAAGGSGASGAMVKTSNGGSSWNQEALPSSGLVRSLAMLNNSRGFASGNGGTILVYSSSPSISLAPTSFSFTAVPGGALPTAQMLQIDNSGGGALNWSIAERFDFDWLSETPLSGTAPTSVTVSITRTDLTAGTYSDTLIVSGNAANSPRKVPVTYTVTPSAPTAISLSPTSFSFGAEPGGALPPPQTLHIDNSGSGTLNWTAAEQLNSDWLSEAPTAGTAPDSVTVSITRTNLTVGTYSDTLIVSGNAANSPQKVPVTYIVAPAVPVISLSPDSFSFSAAEGGALPPTQTLQIGNSGGGTLNWTAAEQLNSDWLSEIPTSGTAPTSVTVSITRTNLTVGTYSDTLIVSGNAANSPKKVPVKFSVLCPAARGDMNGNGILTGADVILMLNCIFLGTGNCELCFADVSCDGLLTAADLVAELNAIFLGTPFNCP